MKDTLPEVAGPSGCAGPLPEGSGGAMLPGLPPGVIAAPARSLLTEARTVWGWRWPRLAPPSPSQNAATSAAAACVEAGGLVTTLDGDVGGGWRGRAR